MTAVPTTAGVRPSPFLSPLSSMSSFLPKQVSSKPTPSLTSVEVALRASLLPADIRDVHLYAFSRRMIYADGAVRIDCPQSIFAIGSILKQTEHFSNLLTSGFSETNPDTSNTIRQYAYESEYDYETDSDLEEFESEIEPPSTPVSGSSSAKGKSKENHDSEVAEHDTPARSKGTDASGIHQILIPNIAHKTLKACIFYLYTGKVNFLPLTSEGGSQRAFALLTAGEHAPPACSPKSMYRLAESYGMAELQTLAYDELISRLKPENIVEQVFSSFFARYDRLREHAVSYLSQHYSDRAIQIVLPDVIQRIVVGDMPHAGGVLQSLLGLRVAVATPFFAPPKGVAEAVSSGAPPVSVFTAADSSAKTTSSIAQERSTIGPAAASGKIDSESEEGLVTPAPVRNATSARRERFRGRAC